MILLGIESTAHTFSCGVVKEGEILSNVIDMYRPPEGGIHPREAAEHHREVAASVIGEALKRAGVKLSEIDAVGYSKGPGLGPALRVGATAARTLAVKLSLPLIPVNHCVAHLEVGRIVGAKDPVLLYVSGGNTQVISFSEGRYRIFGETQDIGVGNMLDKFAREASIPFPGGPEIERLAEEGRRYIELPYSVKGMDVAFSGILTAALTCLKRGERLEDICFSLQETIFAMLTEVTERAMAHLKKSEVLLGGGVARNRRLQEMVRTMAEERGATFFVPPPDLCVDNGAMIAYTAELMYRAGIGVSPEQADVDQRYRTDQVDVVWRGEERGDEVRYEEGVLAKGAEAVLRRRELFGLPAVEKVRVKKSYRLPALDEAIRAGRTRNEARMLEAIREAGVGAPRIYYYDPDGGVIFMEYLEGIRLKEVLEGGADGRVLYLVGEALGRIHSRGLSHGDLTTSNIIIHRGGVFFLDPSFGSRDASEEEMGVDVNLFLEAFRAAHPRWEELLKSFFEGYKESCPFWKEVFKKAEEIERRARYVKGV